MYGGGSILKHSSGVENLQQGQMPGPEQCGINSELGGRKHVLGFRGNSIDCKLHIMITL